MNRDPKTFPDTAHCHPMASAAGHGQSEQRYPSSGSVSGVGVPIGMRMGSTARHRAFCGRADPVAAACARSC